MNSAPDALTQQIRKTQAFLEPDNLARLILKYEGKTALLVVDVQGRYCDPANAAQRGNNETAAVSDRIHALVPAFRKAGIPVYAVYMSYAAEPDFYKFTPDKKDILVAKDRNSAFRGSNIIDLLDRDKKKLLLVCGFNQAACVKDTVLDGRAAGFEICVLDDLAGNDNCVGSSTVRYRQYATQEMKEAGTIVTTAHEVLRNLVPSPSGRRLG